ncbi:hypothetical protein, partial [Mucilaginibacter sp.]|uniref:hypothetical protein n=1 Tax=Mucilaginibacter sp. TaxID=1882438 RepID=UPI003267C699
KSLSLLQITLLSDDGALTARLHLKMLAPFAAEWWYTFPGIITVPNHKRLYFTIKLLFCTFTF